MLGVLTSNALEAFYKLYPCRGGGPWSLIYNIIAGRRSESTAELQRPKARKIKEKGSDKPEKRSRQKRNPSPESSTPQTPVAKIKMAK